MDKISNKIYEQVYAKKQEEFLESLKEGKAGVLDLSNTRAIFPFVRAAVSDKPNGNYRIYTRAGFNQKSEEGKYYGYESWVLPNPKPVIKDHVVSGSWGGDSTPMGRVIWAGYKKNRVATLEDGTGWMSFINAITREDAIKAIMDHLYVNVSIGSIAHSIIDSISGEDILKNWKEKGEYPKHMKGDIVDGKTCYWVIPSFTGIEISQVNAPAEETARIIERDLGYEKVQMLLSEKKVGANEFVFYDALTGEKVDLSEYQSIQSGVDLVDSYKNDNLIFDFINIARKAEETYFGHSETDESDTKTNEIVTETLDDLLDSI